MQVVAPLELNGLVYLVRTQVAVCRVELRRHLVLAHSLGQGVQRASGQAQEFARGGKRPLVVGGRHACSCQNRQSRSSALGWRGPGLLGHRCLLQSVVVRMCRVLRLRLRLGVLTGG